MRYKIKNGLSMPFYLFKVFSDVKRYEETLRETKRLEEIRRDTKRLSYGVAAQAA